MFEQALVEVASSAVMAKPTAARWMSKIVITLALRRGHARFDGWFRPMACRLGSLLGALGFYWVALFPIRSVVFPKFIIYWRIRLLMSLKRGVLHTARFPAITRPSSTLIVVQLSSRVQRLT